MKKIYKNIIVINSLLAFFLLNILLYLFMMSNHTKVPFNSYNYTYNSHHYLEDPKAKSRQFDFFRSLGQYDAQWYLRIATQGYPVHPVINDLGNKKFMNGPSYAFFPLYPLGLYLIDNSVKNIELTAFLFSNLFLLINFISIFFITKRLYCEHTAIKTSFLLFVFPFSIFYRSYFSEVIYLFLILWFAYFLIQRKMILSSLFLSLCNVTRGNGILLNILFFYYLYSHAKKGYISKKKALFISFMTIIPLFIWISYCYIQTGKPLFFFEIQRAWSPLNTFISPLLYAALTPLYNFSVIANFIYLPLHYFNGSKIDCIIIFFILLTLIRSKNKIRPELWWIVLILWLTPLFVKNLLSYSRYQIVAFPIFMYYAHVLKNRYFLPTIILFIIGLFATSLFFINWYWIG